eukprot:6585151-Pyramimonas_sp.AAC.1
MIWTWYVPPNIHIIARNIHIAAADIHRRRGPRQGWSTGHKAPHWAAGRTGLPRPKCVFGQSPVTTDHP